MNVFIITIILFSATRITHRDTCLGKRETGVIENLAKTFELPLPVRSGIFLFIYPRAKRQYFRY